MNKNFCKYFVLLMVSLIVISQSGAYAADSKKAPKPEPKQDAGFAKLANELKLTPEQREKLSKDREYYYSRSKDLREKVRLVRIELKAELDKPGLNKANVDGLIVKIKDLVCQQIQNRVDSIIAMKQTLDPEQFLKMTIFAAESRDAKLENTGNLP